MKYLAAFLLLLTAYGFGRWSAPEKVKIQEKLVYVEKKTENTQTDRDKHKKQVTTIVTHKDGTTTTTTTTVEDTKTDRKTAETDTINVDKSKTTEITRGAKTTVSLLAGTNISSPLGIDYGIAVSKPILGPITIGVFGFRSGLFGASAGLTF